MKKGIHPENYRLVAFKDMSNDHVFLCRSAVSTKETIEVNGETITRKDALHYLVYVFAAHECAHEHRP